MALWLSGIVPVAAEPTVPILPLSEIRAGQRNRENSLERNSNRRIQSEILGVLENAGPKQSIILARLSGGPLDKTGVLQGMSGSPVYIDGKLAGAVAMAFPFSKEPVAGIRPIAEMLDTVPTPRQQAMRANLRNGSVFPAISVTERDTSRPIEIATPISFSGFSSRTMETFGNQLRSVGLEPRQGLTGGRSSARLGPIKTEPGSMISVQLVTGDMAVGADGTVTHVDGDRIYAFGPKFLSLGATDLPFSSASVLTLLANVSTSFKISSTVGETLGGVTTDTTAAVSGQLGRKPRMVPVTISVTGAGNPTSYRMNMVHDRLLSPMCCK
ncbi:MAG: SpoIVB peptidase S55 domain-containing protein [Bryobacteraceae bacterium]